MAIDLAQKPSAGAGASQWPNTAQGLGAHELQGNSMTTMCTVPIGSGFATKPSVVFVLTMGRSLESERSSAMTR